MMEKFKFVSWVSLVLFFTPVLGACATVSTLDTSKEELTIRLSTPEPVDGSLVLVRIHYTGKEKILPSELKVVFEGKESDVFEYESEWGALIGIPFNSAPREAQVEVQWVRGTDQKTWNAPIHIKDGQYPIEHLSVENKYVEPPAKTLKRIVREQKEIGQVYQTNTLHRYWKGAFQLPLKSAVTSPFGGKRYYNGKMRNFHSATDFRASIGTPIQAPEAGRVLLAKNLYFTGNTVILDHGYGLLTLYAHMSQIKVNVGDVVQLGTVLGLSGATGRVSGPHLHWGLILKGQKLNSMDLTHVLK